MEGGLAAEGWGEKADNYNWITTKIKGTNKQNQKHKSRLNEGEERISELEDKVEKNTQKEQEKEKRFRKNEEELRKMQDNVKCNNIHIIGIPEGEEQEQGIENLFEKVENFLNLMREKVTQIQETQGPNQEEPKEAHFKTHYT